MPTENEKRIWEAAGRRIKLARKRLGMSQERFCEEFLEKDLWGAEFNVKTLRRFENEGGLRWKTIEIFANYFRIPVEYLTNLELSDETVTDAMVLARRKLKEAHFYEQSGSPAESPISSVTNDHALSSSFDWEHLARDMAHLVNQSVYGDKGYTLKDIFIFPQADLKIRGFAQWEQVGCLEKYLSNFDFEESKSQGKPIIIFGDFGIGKSCFLKMLCSSLITSGHPLLPVYIPLRELPLYDSANLVNAVKCYLDIYGTIDIINSEKSIILLLDGFDELNFYNNEESWISRSFEQLLSLMRFKNIYLVLSSRPIMFLKEEDHIPVNSPIFRIREFNDSQVTEWLDKWKQIPENSNSGISFENLKQRGLLSIIKNPLLLYMTAKVFDSELKEQKTYSRGLIYKHFYDWTIKGKFALDKQAHNLPDNYRQILQNIAMTIRYIGSNAEYISFDDLQQYITEFQREIPDNDIFTINKLILNAHFFKIKEERSLRYIEFAHKSFREYLIAEKLFEFLRKATSTRSMDYSKWLTLGRHFPSEEEISFLKDLLYTLPDDDLIWIHGNMSTAHLLIGHGAFRKILNEATLRSETEVGTVYYRSINLATLAFVVSNLIYFRLKARWGDLSMDSNVRKRRPQIYKVYHLCHSVANTPNATYTSNWSIAKKFMSGIDLSDLRLDGIDLSNADLDDANLSQASLRQTSFINARLIFSNLSNALCNGSDFTGAYLHSVDFTGTIFRQVTFEKAQVYYSSFINCEFVNVDFSDTTFTDCRFKDCLFKNIIGDTAQLIDCDGFDLK